MNADDRRLLDLAFRYAQSADDAWQECLILKFGDRTGDVRYTAIGRGEDDPSGVLAMLYAAFRKASDYHASLARN